MSFSQPEPNTLYISLTFLSKDPRKNYYVSNGLRVFKSRLIRDSKHWTLYATGNNPPEGTKFHATDHGNSKNPLKYEDERFVNPLRSKNLVVCLKVGYADSHQAIRQSEESSAGKFESSSSAREQMVMPCVPPSRPQTAQ
ncbi:hypothetical protein FVEG_08505 [Fusarium verticillioides 7600]|uniref:Uncharacterized protein n=1 Tax=Gibberella moniliformis (strain M3125 / FGSC 7600) TaxID=334819 RepID=W7MB25_GIBM7|nr:hypothetical protein FVEG_08505 [Fusarium verticillioides 7600]EWG48848.1 hypothetical protein FVEG_08505 [Fusarium verticillioides 7600]